MTKTQERKLKTALKRLEKCGGDCHHCEKCRIYTRSTERALYMAVGCAPSDLVIWAFDEFIRVAQYKAV